MRTTVTIDDELWEKATRYSGITTKSELMRLALTNYVQREAAKAMIALGGSDPGATAAPLRRPPRFVNP